MHKNSQQIFLKHARPFFRDGLRVLEIGPDRHPSTYRELLDVRPAAWDTLDVFAREDVPLDYVALDEYRFPIPDDSYDVVLSGQVIEHVRKIWRWMPELARVCRPGGHVITVNPVSWHYHESPVDCWRIYPEGMRALHEDAGLETVLSVWENVQLGALEQRLPRLARKQRVLQRLSGVLGMLNGLLRFPVEGAYDTVSVARKP